MLIFFSSKIVFFVVFKTWDMQCKGIQAPSTDPNKLPRPSVDVVMKSDCRCILGDVYSLMMIYLQMWDDLRVLLQTTKNTQSKIETSIGKES